MLPEAFGEKKKKVDIFTHIELKHVTHMFVRFPIMCQSGVALLLQSGYAFLLQFNFMPLIWWVLMKSSDFFYV